MRSVHRPANRGQGIAESRSAWPIFELPSVKKHDYAEVRQMVRRLRRELFVNCWCMADGESEGMWRLYGGGQDAVAIQSTYSRLTKAVAGPGLYVGTVRYIDFEVNEVSFRWTFLPALHKRKAFEHERELRAVYNRIFSNEPPLGEYESVNLEELLANIYIAPGSPRWFGETVEKVVDRYSLNVPVRRSQLEASPFE